MCGPRLPLNKEGATREKINFKGEVEYKQGSNSRPPTFIP